MSLDYSCVIDIEIMNMKYMVMLLQSQRTKRVPWNPSPTEPPEPGQLLDPLDSTSVANYTITPVIPYIS